MTDRQREIIKEWEKTKVVHPSYQEIANKVGATKGYCFKIVQRYLKDKKTLLKS